MIKKFLVSISAILAAVMSFSGITAAAENTSASAHYQSISEYFLNGAVPGFGAVGGEWTVLGLSRSGKITDEIAEKYYSAIEAYVREKGSERLHNSKSTENSRLVLALTSIGKTPENVAGYNLLLPLSDYNFVCRQGLNGPVWALIAFDSLQYEIPENASAKVQTTRELLIDYILDSESPEGGWDVSGEGADPDMTAMAVQALAPYKSNEKVNNAVERALGILSETQRENGNFATYGDNTPESCAQVITALCALKIDCEADSRFIKNGNSAIDSLMSFKVTNGFEHAVGNGLNRMSTEQGYYALTAYYRMKEGKSFLYDMCDLLTAHDVNFDGKININDVTLIQKNIAKLSFFNLRQKKLADYNGNGILNISDVTCLQKHIAGYEGYR